MSQVNTTATVPAEELVEQFDDLCADMARVLHGIIERLPDKPRNEPVRTWLNGEIARLQEKAKLLGKPMFPKMPLSSEELVVHLLASQF